MTLKVRWRGMGESVSAGAYVLGQEPSLTDLNPMP